MIDKNLINKAYQESTSVLSKYISTQAKSVYHESQSFKLPNAKSSNKYKKFSPKKPKNHQDRRHPDARIEAVILSAKNHYSKIS